MASRFPIIDPTQLPLMEVLETIDSDAIIDGRMATFIERWNLHDPPAAIEYDVDALEFDPIKITQEANAFYEMLLRDRVNQAARAVTLVYATGGDLTAIASRYPGGVPRLPIVANPRAVETNPEDWETDQSYRRRIWLSPNALTPHGNAEAYAYWALTADPSLKDATAITPVPASGKVIVTLLNAGADPVPTITQISNVQAYLYNTGRKGLTDDVSVLAPQVTLTDYRIRLWLLTNAQPSLTLARVQDALTALVNKNNWLGVDHTLMEINCALNQPGVHSAKIDEPVKDLLVGPRGVVKVKSITVRVMGTLE